MWTEENRWLYERRGLRFPSDLTGRPLRHLFRARIHHRAVGQIGRALSIGAVGSRIAGHVGDHNGYDAAFHPRTSLPVRLTRISEQVFQTYEHRNIGS